MAGFDLKPKTIEADEDGARALFSITEKAAWFSGHFRSQPILPAIALLGMVNEALKSYSEKTDSPMRIKELKRVRFRRIVGPGEKIDVALSREGGDENRFAFSLVVGDEPVADGIIYVERQMAALEIDW